MPITLRVSTLSMLLLAATFSANTSAADLQVKVTSIEEARGKIMVAVYDDESTFRKTVAKTAMKAAVKGEMTFDFPDLPAGDYAVMLYQDVNDNGELDSNLIGMPKEPWGASLQGKRIFGAPKWSDTQFSLPESGSSITIKLN